MPSIAPKPGWVVKSLFLLFVLAPPAWPAENLQHFLNALMKNQKGAVLVTDPRTGHLLAVWNPREAFSSAYPPGSTAKLVTAAAALEEDLITPSDQMFCRKIPELLGNSYHCSHPVSDEPFTLVSALACSCNYFFARLSLRISQAQLAHWFAAFGFGSNPGMIRIGTNNASKARAALGNEGIIVSPAQLLSAYSALANHGTAYRLTSQDDHRGLSSQVITVRLRAETSRTLSAGLEECVQSGTCLECAVPGVRIAGKTGTASAHDGSRLTHAWFVGYAPAAAPEIAVVVFLERGTGQHDAAPLAGKIFRFYFKREGQKP